MKEPPRGTARFAGQHDREKLAAHPSCGCCCCCCMGMTLVAFSPLADDSASYSTAWPSLRLLNPSICTAEKWTKTSSPPLSSAMKPKPFWSLNHLILPVAIAPFLRCDGARRACERARMHACKCDTQGGARRCSHAKAGLPRDTPRRHGTARLPRKCDVHGRVEPGARGSS